MIQRPQRGYGQQRGGLQQLLQPPRRLESAPHLTPFHPQGAGVAPPRPLPGLIPFGSQPQGLQQNSRFTGGNVPGGGMSLVRPPEIPSFQQPNYGTLPQVPQMPQHPLAVLATLLTGAIGGGAGASGAVAPSPPPGGPQRAALTPQVRAGLGGNARPYIPIPQGLSGPQATYAQPPRPTAGPTRAAAPLGALLAALAQRGQRFGAQ